MLRRSKGLEAARGVRFRGNDCGPSGIVPAMDPIEIELADLEAALADGWSVLDVRSAGERAAIPVPVDSHWIPLPQLLSGLADPGPGRWLVLCAHGQRSLYGAAVLRQLGHADATSLRGGLAGLGFGD